MSIGTILRTAALLTALITLTGFTWRVDPCGDAMKIAGSLADQKDEKELRQDEAKILSLCPDGAAAHLVNGRQLERIGNIDGAIQEYRRALRKESAFPSASRNLGLIYAKKGMFDEASVELARALAAKPDPDCQREMGKILARYKVYPLALYYLTEASALLKNDSEIPVATGDIYAATGEPDKALEQYRRALSINQGDEKAHIGIAAILIDRNNLDDALAELKKAEMISPQNLQTHLMMASVYEKKGEDKLAEYEYMMGGKARMNRPVSLTSGESAPVPEDFDRAVAQLRSEIRKRPEKAVQNYERLGNLYKTAGKDAEAIAAYKDAIYYKSTNSDTYLNLGILYEKQGALDEAVVAYKQAVKIRPDNADARLRLAEIRNDRGFLQEAVEQYSEYLKLRPESPEIRLKLARILAKSKETTLAINAYNSVLKQAPDNIEANREIANLYKMKDMEDKATEYYKKVLSLDKTDMESRNALVSLYVKSKKYDEVASLLKEGAELSPDDPNSHYKLGLIYEFRKELEPAMASYKKAAELKPDHARALNAIGRLYMKSGNYDEAKKALEAARKADPNLEEPAVLLNNIRDDFDPKPRKIIKKKGTSKASLKSKKRKSVKPAAKAKSGRQPVKKPVKKKIQGAGQ